MFEDKLTIHIGLHKTATTFLQENVLNQPDSIYLVRGWNSHRNLMEFSSSQKVIISDEGLSGDLFGSSYWRDFKFNMNKLKYLYGDPKIIFGIRGHEKLILSLFRQYLHQGGTENLDYLYNIHNTGLFKNSDLYFEERILLLKEMFTDVFIYTQESLKENPEDFIKSLFTFLGIDEEINLIPKKKRNVGVSTMIQVNTLRKMNIINGYFKKVFFLPDLYSKPFRKLNITPRNFCQNLLKGGGKKFDLSEELKLYIENQFKEDWEKSKKHISF